MSIILLRLLVTTLVILCNSLKSYVGLNNLYNSLNPPARLLFTNICGTVLISSSSSSSNSYLILQKKRLFLPWLPPILLLCIQYYMILNIL